MAKEEVIIIAKPACLNALRQLAQDIIHAVDRYEQNIAPEKKSFEKEPVKPLEVKPGGKEPGTRDKNDSS